MFRRKIRLALLLSLIILLGACVASPGSDSAAAIASTPAVPAPIELTTSEPAIEKVIVEENKASREPETPIIQEVVGASEVEIGELTPVPDDEISAGEVMPEPRSRDPLAKMVSRAREQLSELLDVDVSAIEIIETEAIRWQNSALGCPQPDVDYLMAITPGYQITLAVNGEQFDYRTDEDNMIILCGPDGEPVLPPEN